MINDLQENADTKCECISSFELTWKIPKASPFIASKDFCPSVILLSRRDILTRTRLFPTHVCNEEDYSKHDTKRPYNDVANGEEVVGSAE